MIFASTGTKKPEDPPWKYVEAFAGSDIETNPPATNDAVAKSGRTFTRQVDQLPPQAVLDEIAAKVDIAKLEAVLMEEGLKKFADPQKALLKLIAEKRKALVGEVGRDAECDEEMESGREGERETDDDPLDLPLAPSPPRPSRSHDARPHETRNFWLLVVYQIVLRTGWIFKTESSVMPAAADALDPTRPGPRAGCRCSTASARACRRCWRRGGSRTCRRRSGRSSPRPRR